MVGPNPTDLGRLVVGLEVDSRSYDRALTRINTASAGAAARGTKALQKLSAAIESSSTRLDYVFDTVQIEAYRRSVEALTDAFRPLNVELERFTKAIGAAGQDAVSNSFVPASKLDDKQLTERAEATRELIEAGKNDQAGLIKLLGLLVDLPKSLIPGAGEFLAEVMDPSFATQIRTTLDDLKLKLEELVRLKAEFAEKIGVNFDQIDVSSQENLAKFLQTLARSNGPARTAELIIGEIQNLQRPVDILRNRLQGLVDQYSELQRRALGQDGQAGVGLATGAQTELSTLLDRFSQIAPLAERWADAQERITISLPPTVEAFGLIEERAKSIRENLEGLTGKSGDAKPGGKSFLPGRALGGSVYPGLAFLVGERGPEIFVPDRAGRILPNSILSSGGSGGGLLGDDFDAVIAEIERFGQALDLALEGVPEEVQKIAESVGGSFVQSLEQGRGVMEAMQEAGRKAAGQMLHYLLQSEAVRGELGDLADVIENVLNQALNDSIDSWEDLGRVALEVLQAIIEKMVEAQQAATQYPRFANAIAGEDGTLPQIGVRLAAWRQQYDFTNVPSC